MQGKLTDIFKATSDNIWNYKQNHPELVIKDLKTLNISENIQSIVRQSMLCRGINKWLKVRRDLIAYKKQIKHKIKKLQEIVPKQKIEMSKNYCNIWNVLKEENSVEDFYKYLNLQNSYVINKELLKVYQQIRGDLKKLCMTDRWQIWEGKDLEDMNSIKARD